MLTNKQIALVHVACKELGIGEEDRHMMQEAVGGSWSLTRMSYQGWVELVRHFEACGFENRRQRAEDRRRTTDNGEPLLKKIYALWHQLEGSYYEPGNESRALRGFLKKRFHVDHERFLDTQTAIKVIEAVKAIIIRRLRRLRR